MRKELIENIINIEWDMFTNTKNSGGRASCQDNKEEFIIMRHGQWETMPVDILESYLIDLKNAKDNKRNLMTEKYARMMEYNSPKEYEEIREYLPEIDEENLQIINNILNIYIRWEEKFSEKFPKFSKLCRPIHSSSDTLETTSSETYLRGELMIYSINTNSLYYDYINKCLEDNKDLVYLNYENIVKLKGFESIEQVESGL